MTITTKCRIGYVAPWPLPVATETGVFVVIAVIISATAVASARVRSQWCATSIRPQWRRCRNTKRGICFNRPQCRDGGDAPSVACDGADDDGDGDGSGRSNSGDRGGRRTTVGWTACRLRNSCTYE